MASITGTAASEVLEGGAGDDTIEDREGGADVLRGGGGDDFLWVTRTGSMQAQAVTMEGGDGNDRLWVQSYNASNYTIDAGAGDDRVYLIGVAGGVTVSTGAGADVIELNAGYSNITSTPAMIRVTDFATGAGGDRLDWSAYLSQTLSNWGGGNPFASGHLRLVQSGTDSLLQLDRDGGGNNYSTLFTFQNTTASAFTAANLGGFASDGSAVPGQAINGTDAGETLSGSGGDDVIRGFGGNDTINGGAGDDQIFGGDGGDTLSGGLGNDLTEGGAGDDTIEDREGGADVLRGGGGDDFLWVTRTGSMQAQAVTMEGGDGNDRLWVQSYNASNYTIDAGAGDDRVYLIGVAGGVTVSTGAGADVIELNAGYSNITSTPAMIRVTDFATGAGGDRLDWSAYLSQTLSNWGGGNPFASGHLRLVQSGTDSLLQLDRDGGGNNYSTLFTFQNTTASAFTAANLGGFASDGSAVPGQAINGTDAGETLSGSGGDDVIRGFGGNDTINGGAGDDQIFGGDGGDTLSGGLGNDLTEGGAGDDTIEDREGGADVLRGGGGDDFLWVTRTGSMQAQAVTMEGGDGNDRLWVQSYNASNYTIDAGAGDDRVYLIGVAGGVTVSTGAGADVIELNAGYSNITSTPAMIRVTDFATGAGGDRLDWSAYLSQTLSNWGGGNPFASGHLRLVQSGTDSLLQLDRDGGGNNYSTLFTFQNTTASAFTAANLGYSVVPGPVSAVVNRPASITEGAAAEPLSITFLNVANLSTTIVVTMSGTSTATGQEVSVQLGTYAINVSQAPARDYVYSLGNISVLDDLLIEGLENITLSVTASGQTFAGGGDRQTISISVLDNDSQGSFGADVLTGDAGANLLVGLYGDDVLSGMAGNDVLRGGFGSDRLNGGAGNDILDGGRGSDAVDGGAGEDTLILTGRSTDYFVSRAPNGYTISRAGDRDTVQDVETVSFDGGASVMTMAEFERQAFDPRAYLEANRDVYAVSGLNLEAAREHYFNTGIGEGRSAGSFDALLYIASYADLLVAFGTDQDRGLAHYIGAGMSEGRATNSFDPYSYIAANPDLLAALGNDGERATEHYINHGHAESRATAGFDARLYAASNPDLAREFGTDARAALLHYLDQGFVEGRPTTGFNPLLYAASYTDLAAAFGTNGQAALDHYLAAGADEGRSATGFDPLLYAASYRDLAAAFGTNADAALNHYLSSGRAEGRPATGFDALLYAASYSDLAAAFGTNGVAARAHYLTAGVHEGRATTGFDPLIYAASNVEVAQAFGTDANAALLHYLTTGVHEGLPTTGFDALAYARSYSDLTAAFGNDAAGALNHYLTTGVHEGRNPTGPDAEASHSQVSAGMVLEEDPDDFIGGIGAGTEYGALDQLDANSVLLQESSPHLAEPGVFAWSDMRDGHAWTLSDGNWWDAAPPVLRDGWDYM